MDSLSVSLSVHSSIHLLVCPSLICLSISLSVCPFVQLSYLSVCWSVHPSDCQIVHQTVHRSVCWCVYLLVCQLFCLSVHQSVSLSVFQSVYLSVVFCGFLWLSVCLSVC